MDENKFYVSKETNDEGFTLVELWRIIQANIIWLILAVVLFIFFGWIYTCLLYTSDYCVGEQTQDSRNEAKDARRHRRTACRRLSDDRSRTCGGGFGASFRS